MIRTLLAHQGGLARGALSFLLQREADIDVVAEADRAEDVEPGILTYQPDVTIVDLDLTTPDGLPLACTLHQRHRTARLLALAEPHRLGVLSQALASRFVGILTKDGPSDRLVAAVRAMARGEPVRDPAVTHAVTRRRSPLTPREREVLWMAASGAPVRDIAARLRLSHGTVQNHLSRILCKTGSRSRVQAVNVARHSGWI